MSLIVVDVVGALHVRHVPVTAETIRAEVGDWDIVRLDEPGNVLCGFVSDTGLIDGVTPRNLVGSLMLMSCGGPRQPFAGPVVITGWDPSPSDESEIRPLTPVIADHLQMMHRCITQTLAGDHTCRSCTPRWRAALAEAAEMVRTAPTPGIQIFTPTADGWAEVPQ